MTTSPLLDAVMRADLEAFEFIGCQFWACEGPAFPAVDMITCHCCARVGELRVLLGVSG